MDTQNYEVFHENGTLPILALDVGGRPFDWLNWKDGVTLYARDEIAWEAGSDSIIVHGGINQSTGKQSIMSLNSIVSVKGANVSKKMSIIPALNNRALFARDGYVCMYCGCKFSHSLLTRDHIIPRAQNGCDTWDNVITACKACNNKKSCYTPEQAGMPLLAIPYVPNHAEYLIMGNRKILADQMEFLKLHVPRNRR